MGAGQVIYNSHAAWNKLLANHSHGVDQATANQLHSAYKTKGSGLQSQNHLSHDMSSSLECEYQIRNMTMRVSNSFLFIRIYLWVFAIQDMRQAWRFDASDLGMVGWKSSKGFDFNKHPVVSKATWDHQILWTNSQSGHFCPDVLHHFCQFGLTYTQLIF